MAKNNTGKWLTLAVITGAVAVGVSYFKKYKSFNKELEEDFHDFEDEDTNESDTTSRKYVPLHADKDEFMVAAGDMIDAAKDMAGAAKDTGKRYRRHSF